MSISVSDSSGGGIRAPLRRAIMIYWTSGGSRQTACATIHDVINHEGKAPKLAEGKPLNVEALQDLAVSLSGGRDTWYLPQNVLAASLSRLVWWVPSAKRPIWFKTRDEIKALDKMNGHDVYHPPLLFVAGGGLHVWALKQNVRPTPDTPLFQAPYYNVYDSGNICLGNIKLPSLIYPSHAGQFEKAFFESAGTHNTAKKLTNHSGGFYGFWKSMHHRKAAKPSWFVPTKLKLKHLLKNGTESEDEDP